ncbi:MAG: hypothetical protein NDI61_12515 [Bdellovibrionaceae bacterium]|nr:hypothetical protein [Pseudobdellovibrionaceae bacterium]
MNCPFSSSDDRPVFTRLDKKVKAQNNEDVNLSPGDYLVLNLVLVTIIVASYIFVRKSPRPPSSLNLKNPLTNRKANDENVPTTLGVRNFSRTEYRPRPGNPALFGEVEREEFARAANGGTSAEEVSSQGAHLDATNPDFRIEDSKSLNVLFNWNGHTWDAYEVLGLPAGSSRAAVEAAYDRLKCTVDRDSVPFITAAFHSIVQQGSSRAR